MMWGRSETGEKLLEVRKRLRHKLRGLIEKIDVYPAGNLYRIIPKMKANKKLRSLTIHFKGGSYKVLCPESDTVVTQIYMAEKGVTYFPCLSHCGNWDVDDVVKDSDLVEGDIKREGGEKIICRLLSDKGLNNI